MILLLLSILSCLVSVNDVQCHISFDNIREKHPNFIPPNGIRVKLVKFKLDVLTMSSVFRNCYMFFVPSPLSRTKLGK